ncbi:MAG TPA: NAD-dependent epimerase/dehydratase family protein, partial [Paraburkholderia sp.]
MRRRPRGRHPRIAAPARRQRGCRHSGRIRPVHPNSPSFMKKVLILGVNGFIGHHLSKRILETTDWEVFGMDMQTERLGDLVNHE